MVASLPPRAARLAPEDDWVQDVDIEAFKREVNELGERYRRAQGPEDVAHLQRMISWSNGFGALGLLTMWATPNPITVMALSLWTFSRWTMIAHHTCHGGYNRQDVDGRFNSRGFAIGSLRQRVADWFDWMLPEAWNVEHNSLHHYKLGEVGDPDLVERNLAFLRDNKKVPMVFKYGYVAMVMCMWKWSYYAPNTFKQLKMQEMRRNKQELPEGVDPHSAVTIFEALSGTAGVYGAGEYLKRVMLPYLLLHFVALPLPFLALGGGFFANAVINLLLADIITNIHSFIVIVTNHAGKDLYKFDDGCIPKSGTFYMRQVISSANHRTGGDANDFMHGWLNYQIEHHVWPDLSMLSYQKSQPELQAICEKHGVPYVQENVFLRLKKTVDIMVGASTMRQFEPEWDAEMKLLSARMAEQKQ